MLTSPGWSATSWVERTVRGAITSSVMVGNLITGNFRVYIHFYKNNTHCSHSWEDEVKGNNAHEALSDGLQILAPWCGGGASSGSRFGSPNGETRAVRSCSLLLTSALSFPFLLYSVYPPEETRRVGQKLLWLTLDPTPHLGHRLILGKPCFSP